jgi:hypothetical protein
MEALESSAFTDPAPIVDRVFRTIIDEVGANQAFSGIVAQDFTALLHKVVRFVARCLNADRMEDTGLEYLFHDINGDDPLEDALAHDFRRYLDSSELRRGSFYSELRALGHGRVDVICIFPTHRFVTELKKENDDAAWESLVTQYGAQSAAYHATDEPLGFVLTLDLTRDLNSPPPLLHECFEVRHLTFESDELRTLVFVKVAGRQQRPSTL